MGNESYNRGVSLLGLDCTLIVEGAQIGKQRTSKRQNNMDVQIVIWILYYYCNCNLLLFNLCKSNVLGILNFIVTNLVAWPLCVDTLLLLYVYLFRFIKK